MMSCEALEREAVRREDIRSAKQAARRSFLFGMVAGGLALAGAAKAETINQHVPYAFQNLFQAFGAVGDGVTDDTAAVKAAISFAANAQKWLDGGGQSYAVSGNITLPDHCWIRKAKFNQLTPTISSCRTLYKGSGSDLQLESVAVYRGAQEAVGDPNNYAGIWVGSTSGVYLNRVEVSGNGAGMGIFVQASTLVRIRSPYVHDMVFSAASDPGAEQLFGIRITGTNNYELTAPRVENITSVIASIARPYQTTAIAIDGSDWRIIGGTTKNAGQGIDGSGTAGCFNFTISGHTTQDIDSNGIKLGNSCQAGVVSACTADRCGLYAFVVFGSNSVNTAINADILFQGCVASATGSNGNWSGSNIAAFAALQGSSTTTWPANITFANCEAIDRQMTPTMHFGFRNELAPSSLVYRMVTMWRCTTVGATVANTSGYIGEFFCSLTNQAGQVVATATDTIVVWDNTINDAYAMNTGSGGITIPEAGLYSVICNVEFPQNSTGYRSVVAYLNGSALADRDFKDGSANSASAVKVIFDRVFAKGDVLTFKATQTSGGSLTTTGSETYVIVKREYGAQ